jgi:predicted AlkP superfamily phosphohydrolase/phosphomutase/Flp pilus assembly protein TadD
MSRLIFGRVPRRLAAILLVLAFAAPAVCRRKTGRRSGVRSHKVSAAVEIDDPAERKPSPAVHPRVILVGLDAGDWTLLDRLAADGTMPNLARLVAEGQTARLKSFVPVLSPIIWTTIATGASPQVHGVLDFQEVEPGSGAIVPISGRSRRVPAVWNTASARGLTIGVVGWWASHPAEEVNGFFVSDRATSILFGRSTGGMAFPEPLEQRVRTTVEKENSVSETDLAPYLSMSAQEIAAAHAQGGDLANPVIALEKILGATRTVQHVARDLYDTQRPDLTAVYFEGTDTIGHVFASYVPPKLACVSDEDFRGYSHAVAVYYGTIDKLLGQWMRRAREDGATLLICSDHGFKWEEDRTCGRSSLQWTTAAFWHRLEGVLAVWGARVKPSPTRGEASVYDVAPTLSALLGLPVDKQMSGRPLTNLFEGVGTPAQEAVFASVAVKRLAPRAPSESERSEYAQKLKSLGYLTGSESKSLTAAPEGPWPGRTEGAWNNLGLCQREAGNLAEAERSFREALRLNPTYGSPMFNLAVLERMRSHWPAAVDLLFRACAAGHAEPEHTIVQWSGLAVQANQKRMALSILTQGAARYPASEDIAVALSRFRFEAKDCAGAAAALRPFAAKATRESLNLLGISEMCLGNSAEARSFFERSLALDPGQQPIRQALRALQ